MLPIDPARTALLVMDLQADILAMLGRDATPLLERTAGLIAAARRARLRVIHVVVGFRPGYPEVSGRNPSFSAVTQTGRFLTTTPGSDLVPTVAPREDEVVICKHRVGAFHGTDLELILRARNVDTLMLAGVATSGAVLSTLRHAADADYAIVVVEDCCADRDEEVHRVLTEKVFPRQATVVGVAEVSAAL